jgi:hypothetical protein
MKENRLYIIARPYGPTFGSGDWHFSPLAERIVLKRKDTSGKLMSSSSATTVSDDARSALGGGLAIEQPVRCEAEPVGERGSRPAVRLERRDPGTLRRMQEPQRPFVLVVAATTVPTKNTRIYLSDSKSLLT